MLIAENPLYEQSKTLLACVELVYLVNYDDVMFGLDMLPLRKSSRSVISIGKSFSNALSQVLFVVVLSAKTSSLLAGLFLSHFLQEAQREIFDVGESHCIEHKQLKISDRTFTVGILQFR